MNTEIANRPKHVAARVAGFMFVCSLIIPTLNWIFVLSNFIAPENATSTAHNILANQFMFRIGIINEVITAIVIITLSLALYAILKSVNQNLALLALVLKLIDAFLTVVIALGHLIALQLLSTLDSLTTIHQEQVQVLAGLFLNMHIAVTTIPGIFLGLSMSIFLYLLFKSKYIPAVLAGFGFLSYLLIFIYDLLFLLMPSFSSIPLVQIVGFGPNVLFMPIIGFWLLIKGLNAKTCNVG